MCKYVNNNRDEERNKRLSIFFLFQPWKWISSEALWSFFFFFAKRQSGRRWFHLKLTWELKHERSYLCSDVCWILIRYWVEIISPTPSQTLLTNIKCRQCLERGFQYSSKHTEEIKFLEHTCVAGSATFTLDALISVKVFCLWAKLRKCSSKISSLQRILLKSKLWMLWRLFHRFCNITWKCGTKARNNTAWCLRTIKLPGKRCLSIFNLKLFHLHSVSANTE